jgi:hypothetical protein
MNSRSTRKMLREVTSDTHNTETFMSKQSFSDVTQENKKGVT